MGPLETAQGYTLFIFVFVFPFFSFVFLIHYNKCNTNIIYMSVHLFPEWITDIYTNIYVQFMHT